MINNISNYSQIAAQQGVQSSLSSQNISEADIQQWLASFLNGSSATTASTQASGSSSAVCTGASSSASAVSGQNLIQAMDDQSQNNSNVTSQTHTASTGASGLSVHHHHHGGSSKTSQTDSSWFTDDSDDDSISSPTGGSGDTAPASFASLLNSDNTTNATQSVWNSIV